MCLTGAVCEKVSEQIMYIIYVHNSYKIIVNLQKQCYKEIYNSLWMNVEGRMMNKEQAKKIYEKIIHESNEKTIAVIEEAKKNGTWKQGLDSNNSLFEDINKETIKKIEELVSQIDNV